MEGVYSSNHVGPVHLFGHIWIHHTGYKLSSPFPRITFLLFCPIGNVYYNSFGYELLSLLFSHQ